MEEAHYNLGVRRYDLQSEEDNCHFVSIALILISINVCRNNYNHQGQYKADGDHDVGKDVEDGDEVDFVALLAAQEKYRVVDCKEDKKGEEEDFDAAHPSKSCQLRVGVRVIRF